MVTLLDKRYAEELKKLRKSHKLKQSVMVQFLNLESQQQYSDLENSKKHFTDDLILKICSIFNISVVQLIEEPIQSTVISKFLSKEDLAIIENSKDNETKSVIFKKLFLESKIENIEIKLNSLYTDYNALNAKPGKHRIHVII